MQQLALLAAAVQTTALQRPPVVKRVEVEVTRQLDGVSPKHARDAWLDYSWTSGGGIPAQLFSPSCLEAGQGEGEVTSKGLSPTMRSQGFKPKPQK